MERIELFTLGADDEAPVLQYSVEVTKRDPPAGWSTVPTFVSGPPRRPLSKEAFYSKLGQTPDAALPRVEQMVTITSREEGARPRKGAEGSGSAAAAAATAAGGGGSVVMISGGESSDESDKVVVDVVGGGDDGVKGAGGLVPGSGGSNGGGGPTSTVDVFLVCAAIGGGGAKRMACLPEHRHMKLIPWGGVSRTVGDETFLSVARVVLEKKRCCLVLCWKKTALPLPVRCFLSPPLDGPGVSYTTARPRTNPYNFCVCLLEPRCLSVSGKRHPLCVSGQNEWAFWPWAGPVYPFVNIARCLSPLLRPARARPASLPIRGACRAVDPAIDRCRWPLISAATRGRPRRSRGTPSASCRCR